MTGGQPLIKSIFWLFRGNVAYKETHKKHGSLDRLNSQASTVYMAQESRDMQGKLTSKYIRDRKVGTG
jgi:hypothetical protein